MSDLTRSLANDSARNGKSPIIDEDLQSLSQLADRPRKLHRTLFKIIGKKEIKKMLPVCLKKMRTSAVKQLCLEKLEQVSKESIVKMTLGDTSPSSKLQSESEHRSSRTESPKRGHGIEGEIKESTSRDGLKDHTTKNKSPARTSLAKTKNSPASSSWTSGSGERRWSRSPSAEKTPPRTPRPESNIAQNRDTATDEGTSTWLEDLDTDELELRARALRSLSNRLDRLQGRVPDRDSTS